MNENKTIWKGSRGPLFIRSVWIGNENYRHFILDSKNSFDSVDRKKLCRQSSKARNLRHTNSFMLEHEFENLQLIGSSEIGCPRTKDHHLCNFKDQTPDDKNEGRTKKYPRCRLSFETLRRQIHQNVDNKLNGNNSRKNSNNCITNNCSELDSNLAPNANDDVNLKLSSAISSPKINKLSETTKNQLTERVLNWLDLAGKNTLIRPETALPCLTTTRNTNHSTSLGNRPNYKYENNDDSCDNLKDIIIPKRRILTTDSIIRKQPLRRAESVHHLSLTLNEDDLDLYSNRRFFEASSRCTSALKFGEFFPTTYRCSRKLLQSSQAFRNNRHFNLSSFPSLNEMTSNNSSTSNINSNNNSIGGGGDGGNGGSGHTQMGHSQKARKLNLKKIDPMVEKEYKSIIHRQILENSCNQQIAKRQLHIFMPNLPNKNKMLAATSPAQDCDSCLSTIVGSEMSNVNNKM